ncbi:valine--tRNA ligase [Asticcacaulis excentricus]|uniref:Valine--tRNA ligase n=1 Tax=Asticcacaulis excentricus (strain ATCC 15261 / DSM 4724 / KCTC 12464 / NCIMB 9791 / VKM B-1370 / CB 48) TaxID=573065 RepID=E8RTF0_ASTEC|nr:valine--tRNA ligase [Asticcacaulis excentricus]ADU14771.1 valyl-tRNA synthetase [Asticcacaulis excentricus CB 48]
MLEKTFDPKTVEPRLYEMWETSGAFKPSDDEGAVPFSIVIPPPNVTGSLHIGHALNNTLQDVLMRFERMRGKAALWLPGTDHAGIATQMVVERQLAAAGNVGRRDMGREAFVEKVWQWKAESSGTIQGQLRRLGASCDWSRERFTLDEGLSAAVRKVFVQLYKEGLIYRDKRLVNWDPHFQTAISDLEVEQKEVDGHYWHFAYPLADGVTFDYPVKDEEGHETLETRDYIVVATTRPETMLGDTAVAVHPDDERYQALIGKEVILPITGRRIPIVGDDYADPTKGSGAVKITPAHDFNDFQVGKRHNLPLINILTPFATLNDEVPEAYRGLDRFAARKAIIARAEQDGWLKAIEKTKHMVPHGDRSGVVIEPFLTDQWYVNAGELAKEALAAVEDGRTVFEPKNWEKTYFEWLRNIEPWCISRQLWWGHRIPAWFGPDKNANFDDMSTWYSQIFVAETEEELLEQAKGYYGSEIEVSLAKQPDKAGLAWKDGTNNILERVELRQDEDVLDTWFSSALWPFSTMGWPEQTRDLERFYPTHTLVTGFDIIFFWVARMMMMGLHFTGKAPFQRVFINALVRDEKGQKMSKSKGNVMDPLVLIDEFGADALRFTLSAMSGQGRDIKLAKQRIEGYRNFGTKLWNAHRFAQMNECAAVAGFDPSSVKLTLSRWIRGETHKTVKIVTEALEACAFDDAANALYKFVWNVVCDWYVELSKPILNGEDAEAKAEIRAMTAWVLDQCLILLHPVMPFITEELWAATDGRAKALIVEQWPVYAAAAIDAAADTEINWLINLISEVRSVRSEMNVPGSAKVPLTLTGAGPQTQGWLTMHRDLILFLGRLGEVGVAETAPVGSVPFVIAEATGNLSVAEFIDLKAEAARLAKDIAAFDKTIEGTKRKLDNPEFVKKAPEEVITENQERLKDAEDGKARLSAALERLKAAL